MAANLRFAAEGAPVVPMVIVKWCYSAVDGKRLNGREGTVEDEVEGEDEVEVGEGRVDWWADEEQVSLRELPITTC